MRSTCAGQHRVRLQPLSLARSAHSIIYGARRHTRPKLVRSLNFLEGLNFLAFESAAGAAPLSVPESTHVIREVKDKHEMAPYQTWQVKLVLTQPESPHRRCPSLQSGLSIFTLDIWLLNLPNLTNLTCLVMELNTVVELLN